MRQHWIIGSLLLLTLCIHGRCSRAQTTAADQTPPSYRLSVAVDEVSLTFHATGAHGLPVDDLKLNELTLFDNGEPARQLLSLEPLLNVPLRAGILMDTSQSMSGTRSHDRAIAVEYAQKLLRRQTDRAFVMNFSWISKVSQPWTNDPSALSAGIWNSSVTADGGVTLQGTALYDAIYRACLNQFGSIDNAASDNAVSDNAATGNFILLFSDGEDNSSRASLHQAIDICQHANTAIYAFHSEPDDSSSTGPKTLAELTAQTGGRVFFDDDAEAIIDTDLRLIEANLRNQYRLIYRPQGLKHDGSFHSLFLSTPNRVNSVVIRSGYYAPAPQRKANLLP